MDVADVQARGALRRSCIRVSSAFDAALDQMNAGPVRKVVVGLWSQRQSPPDYLPRRLTRADDVLEVGRSVIPEDLLTMSADDRARNLLRLHHGAMRFLADRYGWDKASVDRAWTVADETGVVARLSLPAVTDRSKLFAAIAGGRVDEEGMHLELTVIETATERRVASTTSTMNGDWHLLRGALNKIIWQEDSVVVEPLRRVATAVTEMPRVLIPAT